LSYCYATIAEGSPSVEQLLGTNQTARLSGDEAGSTIDTDVINAAITDAQAIVNGYCMKNYEVPFATCPELIKKLTLNIAVYYVYENRGAGASDAVRQRYDDSVKILENISSGKIQLGVNNSLIMPRTRPSSSALQVKDRLFYRDSTS